LLKNIAGLWLVQECRRIWELQGRSYDWGQLTEAATASRPLVSLINPDDPRFVAPEDMPAAIQQYCRESGQAVPESDGAVIRCALESLALRYRMVLNWLEDLVGSELKTVHIVGGGTQNRLLCQMAADACGRPVVTGPIEATAIGNIMMQAVADGAVASISEAREVIRNSFDVEQYSPHDTAPWDEAFQRFEKLSAG
jgi:rhamnulokinase